MNKNTVNQGFQRANSRNPQSAFSRNNSFVGSKNFGDGGVNANNKMSLQDLNFMGELEEDNAFAYGN